MKYLILFLSLIVFTACPFDKGDGSTEPKPVHSLEHYLTTKSDGSQKSWVATGYYYQGETMSEYPFFVHGENLPFIGAAALDNVLYFKKSSYHQYNSQQVYLQPSLGYKTLFEAESAFNSDTADYGGWKLDGSTLTINTIVLGETSFVCDTINETRFSGRGLVAGFDVLVKMDAR